MSESDAPMTAHLVDGIEKRKEGRSFYMPEDIYNLKMEK